eukprot:PITA_14434
MKLMAKEKSPGPDGWTIELFLFFFDQIGSEITDVVEESRQKGEVCRPFNSTFIALIPKKDDLETFEDFRPISLCNCIYKIIAKVIALRIFPILSRNISMEQFGFLDGRQIHEAIGVAQEVIHSIRQQKKKGVVFKIDLSKAYDEINWIYLRMLLTHLGFNYSFISWIMGCISNVSYAILINGAASPFFKSQRGLRQGCPLSPLLFLLVEEGLSRLFHKARREEKVKGIEVAINLYITHLLFVDDILLFTNGSINEIKEIKSIFYLFLKATGMQIKHRKSQVSTANIDRRERTLVLNIFPFLHQQLESPFKYLCFWLKPSAYKIEDWNWLIAKIEARISHWSHKWLFRAGRLTLIKSVLLAIPVYWVALTWVPKAKYGWRLISTENLWTRVVRRKYIDPVPLEDWIRSQEKRKKNVSVVWKATVEAFSVIEQGLAWKIGDGRKCRIGRDPWVRCNEAYALSPGFLRHLDHKGIYTLNQVEKIGQSTIWGQAWKSAEDLDLNIRWKNEWCSYIQELHRSNVRLNNDSDLLIWAQGDSGKYNPKDGYNFLMQNKGWSNPDWWSKLIWKLKGPVKAKIFLWCVLKKKVPT